MTVFTTRPFSSKWFRLRYLWKSRLYRRRREEQDQKRWQKLSFAGMGLIGIIVVLGTAISFLRG